MSLVSDRVVTLVEDALSKQVDLDVLVSDAGGLDQLHMMDLFRVSVVVPARNEAENLPYVMARMPAGIHEVIVVDGHSTDDTIGVARRCRPGVVIVEQSGNGKGDALASGFRATTGDIVVMLDADGSTDPEEIPRFVAALLCGADFAKGSRFVSGGGTDDMTPTRRLGNWVLSFSVNRMWGIHYSDLLQRVLEAVSALHRTRLQRLRGRDADEHPGGAVRAQGTRGTQLRARTPPR